MDPHTPRARIPPTHAVGYGGVEELADAEFAAASRALGLALVDEERDDDRPSHTPEAAGVRATFPSLDRISLA